MLGQRGRRQRDQRNALVGGAEQHVEVDARLAGRSRVVAAELGERVARVEESGVEEVRADAAGLQLELAELQHADFQRQLDELRLVSAHGSALARVRRSRAPSGRVSHARRGTRNAPPDESRMRIITLNVNGIRSAARKGLFEWLPRQGADVVCLQEIKAGAEHLDEPPFTSKAFYSYYEPAVKKGYSGVGAAHPRAPGRPRARLRHAGVRPRGPLPRGALRQSQRRVPVRAVGLGGRASPGLQVPLSGGLHEAPAEDPQGSAGATSSAATGTSPTRKST